MNLDQALIASIGVPMAVCIVLVLRGYIEVRFRFGEYLRSNRPEIWSSLVPSHSALEDAVTERILGFDATPKVASFRKEGFREHADGELANRCARANRAERTAILSWFALFAWVVLVFAIIIAQRVA